MLYITVCISYRNMCLCAHARTLYVQYVYILQVHMSTSDNSHTLYWMGLSVAKP